MKKKNQVSKRATDLKPNQDLYPAVEQFPVKTEADLMMIKLDRKMENSKRKLLEENEVKFHSVSPVSIQLPVVDLVSMN